MRTAPPSTPPAFRGACLPRATRLCTPVWRLRAEEGPSTSGHGVVEATSHGLASCRDARHFRLAGVPWTQDGAAT